MILLDAVIARSLKRELQNAGVRFGPNRLVAGVRKVPLSASSALGGLN